jgi:hypothetical protein
VVLGGGGGGGGGGGTPPTKGERKVLRIFPFDDEQSLEGCAYLTKVVVLEDIKPCGIEKNIYIPRADGAKRRARVLIPPGYVHPGKRKH